MPGHCHVKRAIPHIVVEGLGGRMNNKLVMGFVSNQLLYSHICFASGTTISQNCFSVLNRAPLFFPLLSTFHVTYSNLQEAVSCHALSLLHFCQEHHSSGIKWHVVAGRGILINKRGGLPLRRDSMCQWMKLLFLTILSYWPFSALVQNGRGDIFPTFIFTI